MKCGREEGGKNVDHFGVCPAFPYDGKRCATVVGTFCDLVKAMNAIKYSSCLECPFYKSRYFDKTARVANQGKGI